MLVNKLLKQDPRNLFYKASCIFILAVTIFISFDFGITGDETLEKIHGDLSLRYYTSLGSDTSYKNPPKIMPGSENQKYYGAFFDMICTLADKVSPFDTYDTRHLVNSLAGFTTSLFCSFIAIEIAGINAGIIALWLITLSPFFFGHSFNNPKDIPFACFYTISIYYLIHFLKELPLPSKKTVILLTLSIGFAIATRVGGLILLPYVGLFALIFCVIHFRKSITQKITDKKKSKKKNADNTIKAIRSCIKYSLLVIILAYGTGVILWPYALENPLRNPFQALKYASSLPISINVLFEGENIMSSNLPWYFLPKNILITTPEIVWFGLLLLPISFIRYPEKRWILLVLLFSFLFPILYILFKESVLHGSWRHELFVYSSAVVLSAVGIASILKSIKNTKLKYLTCVIVVILLLHPLLFMIKNHPNHYVYFNYTFGGIKNAYGKYETDYYFNSLKEGSKWFKENVLPNDSTKKPIIFSTGATYLKEYFTNDTNVSIKYIRYYERYYHDWDYAILTSIYVNSYQLNNNIWPIKNTIHRVEADGVPLCIVVKRENKDDYYGFLELNKKNFNAAISHFNKAVKYDPNNEGAWLGLCESYLNINDFNNAEQAGYNCLRVYPTFINGLLTYAMVKTRQQKFQEAINLYTRIIDQKPDYILSYYYRGMCYYSTQQSDLAINDLYTAGTYEPRLKKECFTLISNIFKQKGDPAKAKQFLDDASK